MKSSRVYTSIKFGTTKPGITELRIIELRA